MDHPNNSDSSSDLALSSEKNGKKGNRFLNWLRARLIKIGWFIYGMPITVFYRYLWLRNKSLLFKTIAVHYIMPLILELLPWYASKRKIGNYLRTSRVQITHVMSTNGPYSHSEVTRYVILTIYYAILDNINNHLISIVSQENRLQIKRLVMEKLLYSEIGAFDFLKKKKNIGPVEIEYKLSSSINTTISFFTFTIPDLIASLYAFVIEGSELLKNKNKIDPLIVLHPILIAIYQKVSQKLREHLVENNELKFKDTYNSAMSKMISNTAEGLSDIQINNLQETQLNLFDNLIDKELKNTQSFSTLISSTWRSIHNRSVFEFAAEVWVAHKVMNRRNINNQEYRTTLLDINRVIRLGNRLVQSIGSFKNIYKHQKKVKKLLNIPTFIEEDSDLKYIYKFDELKISADLKFSYENKNEPSTPVLDLQDEMVILPGKRYALIGQNRSGKSTLNHLLCKLYTPTEGQISMNGIPYSEISRSSIRRMISYVSQRPFIFPGTILDNIRVGNPSATEAQILEAADAAGVFAFADDNFNLLKTSFDSSENFDPDMEIPPTAPSPPLTPLNSSLKNTTSIIRETEENTTNSTDNLHNNSSIGSSGSGKLSSPFKSSISTNSLSQYNNIDVINKSTIINNNTFIRRNSSMSQLNNNNNNNNNNKATTILDSPTNKALNGAADDLESNKLVKRVWSVLNLTSMNSNDESDEEEENPHSSTPIIVPQIADGISNHPILNQFVEAGGKNISGGFAQSIALARVFVRTEAKVIVLDESLSAMDYYKKFNICLPKLFNFAEKHNITIILVTHDVASIQNLVDHIFVLDHGKLVHQGSHSQLLQENSPVYYKLLGIKKRFKNFSFNNL
ncbi:hypothetical protein DICPUDRAFT_77869 [Dictyostelium purpureum]|uniref:ABC transporter domain-containing protein n=1 Tax=Dictyostelium purpureum TaxID=5786 RepID=F0ZHV3_DICPU|nr:uncharacterized protein DICPUDRAFT_77869 [Dictyostelium purpureum]EGC36488.1 hypothetical protein DICPUDRAFT_77869 [Dictyostelium purpureum]|eukprot:XP_003287001.1 hypothetical protein DICPUDRAFT_77869 [Dictyostelium purpureum]